MKITQKILSSLLLASILLPVLAVQLSLATQNNQPNPSQTGLKIMASTAIPADIVKNILGEKGTVEAVLITPDEETIHHFEGPTEQQKIQIRESNLFVAFGIEKVEPWVKQTIESLGTQAPAVFNLSTPAMLKADPLIENESNPHVWMDPNTIKIMASRLTEKLIEIDAPNAAYYTAQNATYQAKLDALLVRIQGNRSLYEGKKVVVNHPAYTGFTDLLGIQQIVAIDTHGEHEEEPSAAHIQEIKEKMTSENITLIITSPMGNNREVNELARAANAKIIYIAALLYMKDENGNELNDYIQMMDYNLRAMGLPKDPPVEINGFELILPISALGILAVAVLIKKRSK